MNEASVIMRIDFIIIIRRGSHTKSRRLSQAVLDLEDLGTNWMMLV